MQSRPPMEGAPAHGCTADAGCIAAAASATIGWVCVGAKRERVDVAGALGARRHLRFRLTR